MSSHDTMAARFYEKEFRHTGTTYPVHLSVAGIAWAVLGMNQKSFQIPLKEDHVGD